LPFRFPIVNSFEVFGGARVLIILDQRVLFLSRPGVVFLFAVRLVTEETGRSLIARVQSWVGFVPTVAALALVVGGPGGVDAACKRAQRRV
jgi:hypothetical protein